MAKNFTITLDRFGGLNMGGTGEVPIGDGESPDMKNFCVTPTGQLKLREGYRVLQKKEGAVRGLWQGTLNHASLALALIHTTLYRSDDGFASMREIGTVEEGGEVFFLEFCEKVYLMTGRTILACDGEKLEEIEPYRPLIRIASPPTGGGTPFEDVNLLTAKVRQTFSADGVSPTFELAESRVTSIDYVLRDGKELTENVDYIPDAKYGSVRIFGEGEEEVTAAGTDNIEIGYTLWDPHAPEPFFCRYGTTYGGENDTRAFLYGNPTSGAVRYYSGIVNGLPSMNYFPASNLSRVGGGEEITSIVRHYDRQIIFTTHETYFSYPQVQTDETGKKYTSFPVYTLSALRGNAVRGISLLADNKPVSVMPSGLYLWNNTSVRDERNAVCVSERIRRALSEACQKQLRVFLRNATGELYLVTQTGIYVYNYRRDLFYYYEGYQPSCMIEDESCRFLFGTQEGEICVLEGYLDDGRPIEAHWKSGKLFCSDRSHTKNLFEITLGVDSDHASPFSLSWTADNATSVSLSEKVKRAYLLSFDELDFSAFSLETARRAATGRIRANAKRFTHISLCITHPSTAEDLCITHLILRGKINDQTT